MPRRNRRPTPTPTSQKALDRWMEWCKAETEKGQASRIINNRKKGGENHAET